ncbi:MAG: hypothetical protein AAFY70_03845 [Bacteroidota bacterium]
MKPVFILSIITISLLIMRTENVFAQNSYTLTEPKMMDPKTLAEVKQYAIGEWQSLSVELRPTEDRTGSGVIQPTYLKRNFKYLSEEKFVGTITLFADNYGQMPLMEFEFKGDRTYKFFL